MKTETVPKKTRQISAREALAHIPDLNGGFIGNYDAINYFQSRLAKAPEEDGNVLLTGTPGSAKTVLALSYLRERFENQGFYGNDIAEAKQIAEAQAKVIKKSILAQCEYDLRFFQITPTGKQYAFIRIDGATDSEQALRIKVRDATANSADHTFVLIDEIGELFHREHEEMLRPVMTAFEITTYATAQNFRKGKKHKSRTGDEEDSRLRALLRRFPRIIATENPSEIELQRFLARKIHEWDLEVDHPSTIRLLATKSGGVVGFALRSLIRAIDDNRTLTRSQVLSDDPDPINY